MASAGRCPAAGMANPMAVVPSKTAILGSQERDFIVKELRMSNSVDESFLRSFIANGCHAAKRCTLSMNGALCFNLEQS